MGATRDPSPERGAPLGSGSPDEPAHTLPAEPSQITRLPAAKADAGKQRPKTRKKPGNDEPEPTLEDDLPSDGRDEKGEAMIRSLPPNAGKARKEK